MTTDPADPGTPAARFPRLKRPPAYRVVAEALVEEVLQRRLPPGSQLPTETELAEQFGVNRSTVREGVRLLEEAGLVQRRPQKRLVVTRPSPDAVSTQIARAMVLHDVTFHELWVVMMEIEPLSASLAAANAGADDLARLKRNLVETERALGDSAALARLDVEFHDLLAQAGGNKAVPLLRQAVGGLFYPAFRRVFENVEAAGARLLDPHRTILDAVRARDAETARVEMARHIRDFRRGYLKAGLDPDLPVEVAGLG